MNTVTISISEYDKLRGKAKADLDKLTETIKIKDEKIKLLKNSGQYTVLEVNKSVNNLFDFSYSNRLKSEYEEELASLEKLNNSLSFHINDNEALNEKLKEIVAEQYSCNSERIENVIKGLCIKIEKYENSILYKIWSVFRKRN